MKKEDTRPFYDVEVKVTLRAESSDHAIRHVEHILSKGPTMAVDVQDSYPSPEVIGLVES